VSQVIDDTKASEAGPSDGGRRVTPAWLANAKDRGEELLLAGKDLPTKLAAMVVGQLADSAANAKRRADASGRPIEDEVRRIIKAHVLLARTEGAVAGMALTAAETTTLIGSAGTLTIPTAVAGVAGDLAVLSWIQGRMILEIAAVRGMDMEDKEARIRELAILYGIEGALAKQAGEGAGKGLLKIANRLILRHLKGTTLTRLKAIFRVVGINFSRAGVLRFLPFINVPVNAAVNDAATRLMGRRAAKYYALIGSGATPEQAAERMNAS